MSVDYVAVVHSDRLTTTDYKPAEDWCLCPWNVGLTELRARYRRALLERGLREELAEARAAGITGAMLILQDQWAVLGYEKFPAPQDPRGVRASWDPIERVSTITIGADVRGPTRPEPTRRYSPPAAQPDRQSEIDRVAGMVERERRLARK